MVAAKDLFPGDRILLHVTVSTVEQFSKHDFVSVGDAEHNLNLNVEPTAILPVHRSLRNRVTHFLTGHR